MKARDLRWQTAGKSSDDLSFWADARDQPPLAQAPTMDTLLAQVNNVQSTMGDINSQLNTPNLKLKSSTKYLVKNKLTDANDNLRTANPKSVQISPKRPILPQFQGPLGSFFRLSHRWTSTDGSGQSSNCKTSKTKGRVFPRAIFLLIQVKLNKAQQVLEFTSVLLQRCVRS